MSTPNLRPYVIERDEANFKWIVRDTRTNYVAHSFTHHPDAEGCRDSMNSWVAQEQGVRS